MCHLEVRDADPAYLALLLQVGHDAPAFFDIVFRLRPVHLVEIYRVDLQSSQALFDLTTNSFEAVPRLALLIPGSRALGKDVGLRGSRLHGLPNYLLGVPQAIHRRRIDPVHP